MASRIPKQWKHWCKLNGLKPYPRSSRKLSAWLYLQGHGHVWRVNRHDIFQRGDAIAEFDRWALCGTVEPVISYTMPTTLADFTATVSEMNYTK